jgi:D-alanyl-lipoteichoic acid acyltransferase DltB (MBOAT superfamily)
MSPLAHVVVILATLPIAHFLPKVWRLVFLSAAGAMAFLFFSPGSFWIVLATVVEALILERALRNLPRKSMWRQYLPYVVLLNIFTTDFFRGQFRASEILTLGVAFSVVRCFMTLKQLLGSASTTSSQRVVSLMAGGFFLPATVVGPVFSGTSLWDQTTATGASKEPKEPKGSTEFLYRKMFSGWLLSALVAQWLFQLAGGSDLERWTAPLVLLALFGHLFASFWGQSLVAESGAALAGFDVPQNFNRPWLATDIRDFWNRWHMSMAKFVTQYIFLPLNLRGISPRIATMSSFVFMGLWHEFRIGYIVWGAAHGALMAYAPKSSATWKPMVKWANRIATLASVIVLSYVANYAFK